MKIIGVHLPLWGGWAQGRPCGCGQGDQLTRSPSPGWIAALHFRGVGGRQGCDVYQGDLLVATSWRPGRSTSQPWKCGNPSLCWYGGMAAIHPGEGWRQTNVGMEWMMDCSTSLPCSHSSIPPYQGRSTSQPWLLFRLRPWLPTEGLTALTSPGSNTRSPRTQINALN